MPWSSFFECWVLSQLFPLSSFTFIKRLFSSSSLSAIRAVSSAYLRLLMFLLLILIPACNSSISALLMMCSENSLNKQGDSRQPCCTPFSILNQSVVPYRVLPVASLPTYRFLRRQVSSLRAFHGLSWSTQSKTIVWSMKQRKIFFWNFLDFFRIQWMLTIWSVGSSAFSKPSL